METRALTDADRALIERAEEAIKACFKPGTTRTSRCVGAAIRAETGAVYTGVNLTADAYSASICAEPVAFGQAVQNNEEEIDAMVAVLHPQPDSGEPMRIIQPCGTCRELFHDYDPDADVIIEDGGEPVKVVVSDLLPGITHRTREPSE